MTANLEYHYHQAGISGQEWNRLVAAARGSVYAQAALWALRLSTSAQQEPLMQHEFFVRLDFPDLGIRDFNLNAIALFNPYDGSVLDQVAAIYFLSNRWTLGAYLTNTWGNSETEKGSLPRSTTGILQGICYF